MSWSWRLGKIAGIPIFIHGTFWILVALIAFSHAAGGATPAAILSGVGFILAIFGCVLLHELGHALAARRYGIRTRDIVLLPLGGMARLERMPEKPGQEIVVALAGPAVNVIIAAVLAVVLWAGRAFVPASELGLAAGPFLERLLAVNIILTVFNLLPAFPMDGGRVLRALLATRLDYGRATRFAARVGQGVAVLFGILGLYVNPFLVLIAVFVFLGARQEAAHVTLRESLGDGTAGQAMLREFRSLRPDSTIEEALQVAMSGAQRELPVLSGKTFLGFVDASELVREIRRRSGVAYVGGLVHDAGAAIESAEPLVSALDRMISEDVRVLPVVEDGRLVGLLSIPRIFDYAQWREAIGSFADVPPPEPKVTIRG